MFKSLKYYFVFIVLILGVLYRIDYSCFTTECPISNSKNVFVDNPVFLYIREKCIQLATNAFPTPYSELLLGMTIGIDELKNYPLFKTALKNTGTIHVVVVSGFNISLVFGSVIKLLGSRYEYKNLFIAQVFTSLYSLLSGFEPPVVRSLIMGSILAWGKYYGRGMDVSLVLIFSGLIMILIQPLYFFNLSFRLSFMATLSLIIFSDLIKIYIKIPDNVFVEDFISGFSAQLLVWPIISYYFGTVSIISLVVNSLILWTVPLTTILGSLFLIFSLLSPYLGFVLIIPLYILMDIFIKGVLFFNQFSWGYFDFKLNLTFLVVYYLLLSVLVFYFKIKNKPNVN